MRRAIVVAASIPILLVTAWWTLALVLTGPDPEWLRMAIRVDLCAGHAGDAALVAPVRLGARGPQVLMARGLPVASRVRRPAARHGKMIPTSGIDMSH